MIPKQQGRNITATLIKDLIFIITSIAISFITTQKPHPHHHS